MAFTALLHKCPIWRESKYHTFNPKQTNLNLGV
nr:MAG TPA: hypothetical protein [Caudoviricetes sp.]